MYADDIVFLCDSVEGIQLMINRLNEYCKCWNLKVNLDKSKMMVFRDGGGRFSRLEKWKFDGEEVEIVRKYKYLGMLISSNLSMKTHLAEKLSDAKRAIASVWKRCFINKFISHTSKQQLFQSTASSVMLYGTQVWGYSSYETVEKFLRYFLKRVFHIPKTTPNYMLYLEMGRAPMFLTTLQMHFNYITKVWEMKDDRFPKIILKQIIRTGGSLWQEWNDIALQCGVDFNIELNDQTLTLKNKFNVILEKLGQALYKKYLDEAESSVFRNWYKRLEHNLGERTYFLNNYSAEKIGTLFKIRGELLNLNFMPHRPDLSTICGICNMNMREDVFHFLSVCPILGEFRVMLFGKNTLEETETISILNGEKGWNVLFEYAISALHYRKCILNGDF